MHALDQLALAGQRAAEPYGRQREWLHRIVESLSFPSPDELLVRREVSFDLTIPDGLLPTQERPGGVPTFYVPLSFIRKWPPIIGFDLHDAAGHALPFLTRAQNDVIDYALLIAAGDAVIGQGTAVGELPAQLEELVRTPRDAASKAFYAVVEPGQISGEAGALRRRLASDETFRILAYNLVSQTVLWAPVAGLPGERHIVKLGYDIRREFSLFFWRRAAYGWTSFKADFELPHIGDAGSYHLDIATPSPLRVWDARLRLSPPEQDDEAADEDPFGPLPQSEVDERRRLTIHERPDSAVLRRTARRTTVTGTGRSTSREIVATTPRHGSRSASTKRATYVAPAEPRS